MSRKKVTQVRLGLESLEDRMVLSSMGMLPLPTGTPPPALLSSSQLPGMITTVSHGQLPGLTMTGENGQEYLVLNSGANGQLPPGLTTTAANGQLPGLMTGAEGQERIFMMNSSTVGSKGQGQVVTESGSNGQLPGFGELPGMMTSGANGQLPGLATGAKGQEHIIMMNSGTVGSKGQEHVVLMSGANGQLPDLTTTDWIFGVMKGALGASDLAIGQQTS